MTNQAPTRQAGSGGFTGGWRSIALIGGVFALYLLSIRPAKPPAGWGTDFDQAVIEAKATGRNLLVAFTLHGCMPCAMMDEQVLPKPRVKAAMASFVPVRVSLDDQPELARRFDVYAAPTYAVMRPDGTILNRYSGFQSVEQFLSFLDQTSTRSVVKSQ